MTEPAQVERIVARIKPLLAGHAPEVQGAVLADLLALFIAGHHPALRAELMIEHMAAVRDLIPLNEEWMFPDGLPDGWAKQ